MFHNAPFCNGNKHLYFGWKMVRVMLGICLMYCGICEMDVLLSIGKSIVIFRYLTVPPNKYNIWWLPWHISRIAMMVSAEMLPCAKYAHTMYYIMLRRALLVQSSFIIPHYHTCRWCNILKKIFIRADIIYIHIYIYLYGFNHFSV